MKIIKGIILLLLLSPLAQATYSMTTLCLSPVHAPFQYIENFQLEPFQSLRIGIFGYLAGKHSKMLEEAQVALMENPERAALVLFMEPDEYTNDYCEQDGDVIYRKAKIRFEDRNFEMKAAMKKATQWVTDIVTDDYPECPSACSFASTTKIEIISDELFVQSALRCASKRKTKVNLVQTSLLYH